MGNTYYSAPPEPPIDMAKPRGGSGTCYGVLVDVSGSMQDALTNQVQDDIKLEGKYVNRAHAVFNTIFKTVKEDLNCVDNDNKYNETETIFSLAFGLSDAANQHCDLFGLFEIVLTSCETKDNCIKILNGYNLHQNVSKYIKHIQDSDLCEITGHEPLIQLAKQNGAPFAGEYIKKYTTAQRAGEMFLQFHHRKKLIGPMIQLLPMACKYENAHKGISGFKQYSLGMGDMAEARSADTAIKTAEKMIQEPMYKMIRKTRTRRNIIKIVDQLSVLYPMDDSKQNNDNDKALGIDKLLTRIKPYIFGGTPMCKSLSNAQRIFELNGNKHQKRRLLIISDGDATDGNPIPYAKKLSEADIIIVCCFITNEDISNPTQLYDKKNYKWSNGARTMFDMASFMTNTDSSLSQLEREGWHLAPSGQSKLFIQANHPEIIEQFCGIVNHMMQYNDAIMDLVGHYDFDICINNKITNEAAPHQEGGTCYANAATMGLHMAMSRIEGRDGGIPDFDSLRKKIIAKYGVDGANTEKVIDEYTRQHRLHYQEVITSNKIRNVISKRRPLVARFNLSEEGWDNFSDFFKENKEGILKREDITKNSGNMYFKVLNDTELYHDRLLKKKTKDAVKCGKIIKGVFITKQIVKLNYWDSNQKKWNAIYCDSKYVKQVDGQLYDGGGHAIVLIRCEFKPEPCLVFMNSWGKTWGDNGLFRIANKNVLGFKSYGMQFFDIYWTLNDLSKNEKNAWTVYCKQQVEDRINKFIPNSLFGLKYKCPKCNQWSKINAYKGDFLDAVCPKCNQKFKPNTVGLVRSLYDRQISKL